MAARSKGLPSPVAVGRALRLAMALLASLAFAWPVRACPKCAAGRDARAQIWTDDFGINLFLALVPFLIVGAVSARANRIGKAEMPPRLPAPTTAETTTPE
jgi:hypothetical protein